MEQTHAQCQHTRMQQEEVLILLLKRGRGVKSPLEKETTRKGLHLLPQPPVLRQNQSRCTCSQFYLNELRLMMGSLDLWQKF